MTATDTIHATALALADAGVLLRGPSGAGKSDLAMRCLALGRHPFACAPFRLVADDRVKVTVRDGRLELAAPAVLRGLIEVRGVGIMSLADDLVVAPGATVRLALVIDLLSDPAGGLPERLPPEPAELTLIAGIGVPRLALLPLEASAPLKVALALSRYVDATTTEDGDRGGTPAPGSPKIGPN